MKLFATALATLAALIAQPAAAAPTLWKEGTHYVVADTVNRQVVPPGKTLITEVFSYACPACNAFEPTMIKLRASMPAATTQFEFIPAGFIPAEDWPMFQRAFLTAQALKIADKTHDAMFKAVWTTGELATMDPVSHALKQSQPTIEDAAKWYAKQAGVKADDFVSMSKQFSIEMQIKKADEFIRNYKILSTPTMVVNGRYVTDVRAAGGYEQMVELVKYLAAKDAH